MSFRAQALVLMSAALCGPALAQVTVPAGFNATSIPFGSEVDGIAVSTGGAYGNYVYVGTNGAVKRVDPATGVVSNFATGLATGSGRPSGVSFDSGVFGTGMLYVVDNLARVQSISSTGMVATLSSGGSMSSSNDLAFAPVGSSFGNLLFVSNGAGGPATISKVDSAGVNMVFAAASNFAASPLGLDFPPPGSAFAGDLYVCVFLTDKLSRVTSAGVGTTFATGLGQLIDIAFSPDPTGPFGDFAYVTDTQTNVVRRVAPDASVTTFATGFAFGSVGWDADLAFAPDGSALYVGSGNNIVAIRPCGSVETYCTAKTNSQGCVPSIGWSGMPDVTGTSDFVIRCNSVLELKAGILFYGFAPNDAPFQGGFLCAKAPVTRTPPQLAVGSSCASTYSFDFDAHIRSGKDPSLTAFTVVFAQWWMRDPQSPSTTGLSNALRFRICP
jgi:hypothetical protein